MTRALTVWWDLSEVGEIALTNGNMTFRYAQAWLDNARAPAVSISLPKQAEVFTRAQTRPFFAGLLPEETPRTEAARALGVSQQNDFGLLEGLGGDVAGALALWPTGEKAPQPDTAGTPAIQDEAALAAILASLPRRPLLAGEQGIRLSLAGAQPKVPVVLVGGAVALPPAGRPTSHIIKPAPRDYPTFPENEAFCMRLAAELGLPVAAVEVRRAGDQVYLLVERYDRVNGDDGILQRLHQEDFCQALGITPEHKYAAEGGPNFQDGFELLRRATTVPAKAVLALVDAALFNLIIGNADAHGKNFSLLYARDEMRLAPLYDLLSTSLYPEVHAKMAMRMGGAARLEDFTPETLKDFAEQAGVAAPYVRRRCLDLARRAGKAMTGVGRRLIEEGAPVETIDALTAHISQRVSALMAVANLTGPNFMARFDPDIAADRLGVVASAVQAFRADQPAVARYAAARLAGRVFSIHPDFQANAGKLEAWMKTEPDWRSMIERFASDPDRLAGYVYEALASLQAFDGTAGAETADAP